MMPSSNRIQLVEPAPNRTEHPESCVCKECCDARQANMGWWARLATASRKRKPQVIKVVRGHNLALQTKIRRMPRKGYVVESIASRKAAWSATAGLFTRKHVHTVIFKLES